ncbi:MAG: hypothetical protein Q7J98_01575 [Kiritimatiellia bacterium]|nr:hypothetical protein [Kiritimatiellia bacterium]
MSAENKNQSLCLDVFLRRLLAAPTGKQEAAINSALALLDGSPPPDRLLYNAIESARQLHVSTQQFWRLRKNGVIRGVVIPGMKNPRYRRADIEKLAGGEGGQR